MISLNTNKVIRLVKYKLFAIFASSLFVASNSLLVIGNANASSIQELNVLNINATGSGTNWLFQYPEYGIESKSLTFPNNRKVALNVATVGINDTLWIPKLGVKIDANPFQNVSTELTVLKSQSFSILSVSLCDIHKKHMVLGIGNVMNSNDFSKWVKANGGHKA